jgi:glycosyltransferase involved in cell wall biosynthesis
VIPTRNRADLLKLTLQAIARQDLEKSEYEVIVCNDGGTEDLTSAFELLHTGGVNFQVLNLPPRGPASARNSGIVASKSDIVTFVDSDVIPNECLIRRLVEDLEEDKDAVGTEACLTPIGEETGPLWDAPSSTSGGGYHTAAISYRRADLLAVGGFDETFKLAACEDVEIAARLLERGTILFVPDAIAKHPTRRVTLATHIRWQKHWQYHVILATRYGIFAFPSNRIGPFPRLRLALAASVTLPLGRAMEAIKQLPTNLLDGGLALAYAATDVALGLASVPEILTMKVEDRVDYLNCREAHEG